MPNIENGLRPLLAVPATGPQAYIGAPDPHDEVLITGVPDLAVRITGGTHGDIGTVAIVVNAIPRVVGAPAGLVTMKDLPIVVCAAAPPPSA